MGRFADIAARQPLETFVVPVSAFADTWEDKPKTTICVGLRTIATQDLRTARAQAAEMANRCHPDVAPEDGDKFGAWIEAYNDMLMAWIVARGTCDPNDVNMPVEVWAAGPEDLVPLTLTKGGKQLLFDRWEMMTIAVDPTGRMASDDELTTGLPLLMQHTDKLAKNKAARLRRLAAFILDELAKVAPQSADPPVVDPDSDDSATA